MNASEHASQSLLTAAIGTPIEGGFLAGRFRIDDQPYALIRAPKATGQHRDVELLRDWRTPVAGASSMVDGLANTRAFAAAGSTIAQWGLDQTIGGHNDWYIPALDELELLYRAFKPTSDSNSLYGRSGINLHALPPTPPYTADLPWQTDLTDFREGGREAMDDVWYWSSTQYAGYDAYAWCQGFDDGNQGSYHKNRRLRVVLVRRVAL